jgi:hypothetical protein
MSDRRTRRSTSPAEAIRLFFQAILGRQSLGAIVLANEDGLMIASAASTTCHALDLDWIGALGSVCALGTPSSRRGASLGQLVERATGGLPLEARELSLRGERLYVTVVGGRLPRGSELADGIERILASSLPAMA